MVWSFGAILILLLFLTWEGNAFLTPLVPHKQYHTALCTSRINNNLQQPNDDGVSSSSSSSSSSQRRRLLFQTAGVLSTAPIVLQANAEPSIVSSIQGPVQDIIAPGHWLGQLFGLNSKTVQWNFDASPEMVSKTLVDVLDRLTPEQRSRLFMPNFDITRADSSKVHVRTWTKNEWLDSMDVVFQKSDGGSCVAKASFYATGFLPTSIPGAPIINIGFAWFPFASSGPRGEMLQDFRLRVIQGLVSRRLQEAS